MVGAGGDEGLLRRERDHVHPLLVEVERRPDAQQKSGGYQQRTGRRRVGGAETVYSKKPIDPGPDKSEAESDRDNADVVQDAFDEIDPLRRVHEGAGRR